MKKLLLTFTLFLGLTSIFAQSNFTSGLDFSIFYHPSFDLTEEPELPMRSSIGSRVLLTPIAFNINNFRISLNTGIMFVSESITYNNAMMRGYSGFDLDLGVNYKFNNVFQTRLLFGAGKLQLGNNDLVEAYLIGSAIPTFTLYETSSVHITLITPFNFIYRKQLISTTFGIGIDINLKWRENFIAD